ncbi:MAG TPA: hypothetical protein VEA69_16965 [Tepidisphaeraceae bacterium]|nr:hypothetical protein [Tepidisphaeraceae bacterium]
MTERFLIVAALLAGGVVGGCDRRGDDAAPAAAVAREPVFTTGGVSPVDPMGNVLPAQRLTRWQRGCLLPRPQPRDPLTIPAGVRLLSVGRPVRLSDPEPILGDGPMVTDGQREASDGDWIEMGPGLQWAQVDLGRAVEIEAVVVWHTYVEPRVYRAVIVEASDDPEFRAGVVTLFNNDWDNSARRGLGADAEYVEAVQGKHVDGRRTRARYVRCYSRGNTADAYNHVTEVEVWGK